MVVLANLDLPVTYVYVRLDLTESIVPWKQIHARQTLVGTEQLARELEMDLDVPAKLVFGGTDAK